MLTLLTNWAFFAFLFDSDFATCPNPWGLVLSQPFAHPLGNPDRLKNPWSAGAVVGILLPGLGSRFAFARRRLVSLAGCSPFPGVSAAPFSAVRAYAGLFSVRFRPRNICFFFPNCFNRRSRKVLRRTNNPGPLGPFGILAILAGRVRLV